jgi:nitrogen regulatory protein PII-like uncharacterized protein
VQNHIDKLIEAIVYVDNEALKLRDKAESVRDIPSEFRALGSQKRKLYTTKKAVLDAMSEQNLISTKGYIVQDVKGLKTKVYQNRVIGDERERVITSLKPYSKDLSQKSVHMGTLSGLMCHRELESELDMDKALRIISDYIESGSGGDKVEYPVKEIKLVKLSKVKVVKDEHRDLKLSQEKYKVEKQRLMGAVDDNKGRYPKSEAILVRRRKDPEDKRRVIYHLEDGLTSYLIAQELGLTDIQVKIIDEILV